MGQGVCNGCTNSGHAEMVDLILRANKKAPAVLASPALEVMAIQLRRLLGEESQDIGNPVRWDLFKSGDPDTKFHFECVAGRHVVFLFDSVDQSRLFEQLSLLQALQGFPVPDGEDASTKWKTYSKTGRYAWGRAAKVTVVIPWYRPCQMERTSRWEPQGDSWSNAEAAGHWLDVPTAVTLTRLLATPPTLPPAPGPCTTLDGMPLSPLWVPPLELMFVELHEEAPVQSVARQLRGESLTVSTERFVPYFLQSFKAQPKYPGNDAMYVLFPDHGAYDRYCQAVLLHLGLEANHILWMKKVRTGGTVEQVQKLFFLQDQDAAKEPGEKTAFAETDHVLIVDDFTNSGSTLFGAVGLVRSKVEAGPGSNPGAALPVSIFVSHLVAAYDEQVVWALLGKLHGLGPLCRLYTTNTIPLTTDLLLQDPQVEVMSIVDFLASRLR